MGTTASLLHRLGLRYPIVQAPMAGVSTPRLAAAVSEAGGLGSLGVGASTLAQARQAIEETRALTRNPFNVNVFCHAPAQRDAVREAAWIGRLAPLFAEAGEAPPQALEEIYTSFLADDEALSLLLELRPAVVSFHFGLPSADRIQALREAGIVTFATATNPAEARLIERAGVDAIVAQGIEAGGHRGRFDPYAAALAPGNTEIDEQLGLLVLTRLLVRRTTLPVIAAGGIMDGRGIRAVLDLGAAAAQLGTAFILCPESAASDPYRADLKSARASSTRLTGIFSGRPARGIVNRLIRLLDSAEGAEPAAYPVAYDAAKRLNAAASRHGNHEFAAHWAGQGAPLARELPAAELMRALVDELHG